MAESQVLSARGVTVAFRGRTVLDDVSVDVRPGRILGLVGPSGAGKSTLAKVLSGRIEPTAGSVIGGGPVRVAMIGQAPRDACDPRWTLRRTIGEPFRIAAGGRLGREAFGEREAVDAAAESVLLDGELLGRRPDGVSDGQLQRAVIARALVQEARFLICDEPTSMLDPITAAGVVAVLRERAAAGAGVLFISHDHRLLDAVADEVMELG
ncbi:MAG: ATP-binding cassette domain-containing protein [Corynebacterium sp.]|jgi:peptide/nickel transport system ATP-binding protein|nr:ATP-binding cassette domain-containing protein [Corynebacterium sp.]